MKIDITKIENYESMTAEEKVKYFEAFEYDDNSAEIEKLRNAVSKSNKESAEWKRKHNELLSEEEKAKLANEESFNSMKAELEALRREKSLSEYKAQYMALGYDEALATSTAEAFLDGNSTKIFANHKKYLEDTKKKLEAEILRGTPRPAEGGAGSKGITKEQFEKFNYWERKEFLETNPDLYNEFTK